MEEEYEHHRVVELTKQGHTFHCACRIVTGDGECECNKTDIIPGAISARMYKGRCRVCLADNGRKHEDWCRNRKR